MRKVEKVVTSEDEGIRVDAFLAREAGLTRSRVQRLMEEGQARVNGELPRKSGEKLAAGQRVELTIPDPELLEAKPSNIDIPILYEDHDILIVNKPRYLVVHPAAGHQEDTLSTRCCTRWRICPALAARCAPASCTGWIRTRRGCSWWQKMMKRM